MALKGKAHVVGDDINTDLIVPGKYLSISDPVELGKYCLAGMDENFSKRVSKGDFLVAGRNFGSGSSREHAPVAIKACGISCVIAESFARIFFRNAFNMGLPILVAPDAVAATNSSDELEVDLGTGKIFNLNTGTSFQATPIPGFMRDIIAAGGLIDKVKGQFETADGK